MIWRYVSFAMAGIGAVLVVGTFTGDHYVELSGRTGIFLFGIMLGLAVSGVGVAMRRVPVRLGCAGFGIATILVGAFVAEAAAAMLPDVTLSPSGAIMTGIAAALTCCVPYAVFDEAEPAQAAVAPVDAPSYGAEEDEAV